MFEGVIYITPGTLDRSGGGISENSKYHSFCHILKETERQLAEYYKRSVQESFTGADASSLRKALMNAVRESGITNLPKTPVVDPAGEDEEEGERSNLGQKRGKQKRTRVGRRPYADIQGESSSQSRPPRERQSKKRMGVAYVKALKWNLGPFKTSKNHLMYTESGKGIEINTTNPSFISWVSPVGEILPQVKVRRRKLLYMAMITCMVIANHEMPHEMYGVEEWRNMSHNLYLIVAEKLG